jgi:hypothetical protein
MLANDEQGRGNEGKGVVVAVKGGVGGKIWSCWQFASDSQFQVPLEALTSPTIFKLYTSTSHPGHVVSDDANAPACVSQQPAVAACCGLSLVSAKTRHIEQVPTNSSHGPAAMFSACKLSALIVAQAVVIAAGFTALTARPQTNQGWTALAHLDDSGVYDDDALRSCPGGVNVTNGLRGKCVYMKSRNGWIQASDEAIDTVSRQ